MRQPSPRGQIKERSFVGFFVCFFCAEIHELHILNLYTSSMNLKVP